MASNIQEICNSALKKCGINFFNYARLYDDGTCYLLSNNDDVIEYLFREEAPLFCPVPQDIIKDKFYYLLPTDGPYQKVVHDVKNYFDIANSFDIFTRHHDYIDACCFSSSSSNQNSINYYFNNIEMLENFISYFKDKAAALISQKNNTKLNLPQAMRLNFDSKTEIQLDKTILLTTEIKSSEYNLTRREKELLRFISNGKTAKEIAMHCSLSYRTVEHHIENIKRKLGIQLKSDLIAKAQELFFGSC